MYAYFNNITERAMDGNKAKVPPVVSIMTDENREKLDGLNKQIAAVNKQIAPFSQKSKAYKEWLAAAEKGSLKLKKPDKPYLQLGFEDINSLKIPMIGTAAPTAADLKSKAFDGKRHLAAGKNGKALKLDGKDFVEVGNFANFEKDQAFSYGGWIKHNGLNGATLISRMNNNSYHRGWDLYFQYDQVAVHIIHSWPGDCLKVVSKDKVPRNKWSHVYATYDGSGKASGVKIYINGKRQSLNVEKNSLTKTIKTDVPLNIGRRYTNAPFKGEIDDVVIFDRLLSAKEVLGLYGKVPVEAILKKPAKQRNKKQKDELHRFYLSNFSKGYKQHEDKLRSLSNQKKKIEESSPTTMVMQERATPRGAYVLKRGQYDQRGEKVEPGTPAFLPPFPKGEPNNRLGFAKWLLLKDHPLTSRVTVNRFWLQLFGTGIVKTAEDFGSQGEWPSNPALLDHLSWRFMNEGWDIKKLMKYMVMSSAYRQSSKISAAALNADPYNRLISRGPRFRLDAEMLRDNALAVSGLLVNKVGGESVKPYQPSGIWKAVGYSGSNTVKFVQDKGEKLYRRTLYTFLKRTAPAPVMSNFDAPNRESCAVRRERTNTPLQALQLMNDIQFIEAARHLATKALKEGKDDDVRIKTMFRRLTARFPNQKEISIIKKTLGNFREIYTKDTKAAGELLMHGESKADPSLDNSELASWTMLANQMLNLDEVITKE
jgi:hypothetical protein